MLIYNLKLVFQQGTKRAGYVLFVNIFSNGLLYILQGQRFFAFVRIVYLDILLFYLLLFFEDVGEFRGILLGRSSSDRCLYFRRRGSSWCLWCRLWSFYLNLF